MRNEGEAKVPSALSVAERPIGRALPWGKHALFPRGVATCLRGAGSSCHLAPPRLGGGGPKRPLLPPGPERSGHSGSPAVPLGWLGAALPGSPRSAMGLACTLFLRAGPGRCVLRPPSSRLLCRDLQANFAKKLKPVEDESGKASPRSPALSPEQQERIRRNKEAALQRLASRSVPAGFGEGWRWQLAGEFTKPYFSQLMAFVADERKRHTIYPPPQQVFTWTQMCDIRDVKVVILGQDPYHGPSQAHGLCFSVQRPVPPPPSLENIYKELSADIEDFTHPGHGDLTGWAKQGVLLLNAVLTVRAHQANSHKEKGWEQFTDAVVSWLNNNLDGLVFMLWGAYAQKKGSSIDRKRHHILQTVHPSPLSVHRGFFGCRHFSKTNELLKKSGKKPIDWREL